MFVAQPADAEQDADDRADSVAQVATNQDDLPPFVEPDFATDLAGDEAVPSGDELPTELLPGSQDQGVATPDAFAGVLALVSGLSQDEVAGQGLQPEKSKTTASRRPFVSPNAELLRGNLEAARGAEVVCVIRDRNKPDGPSRIVIIHEASDRFVSDLTSEVENQVQPTSLKVRTPQARPTTAASNVVVPVKYSRYRRQR